MPVLPVGLAGEVAFAGLNFPFLIPSPNLDAPEGSIFGRIGWCVADCILAAQLVLELFEGILQRHLTIDMEYMTTGVFRKLPQV